ncbi:MAG TPA: FkbM family methyltransferase [Chthoniobacterales bacterium]|jgi:FkbM family methyltransferase
MLSTKQKIGVARLLSRAACAARKLAGHSSRDIFHRGGLAYELDLHEGIDLSIYLFGAFEPDVVAYYTPVLREGSVVLDIGANIGAHALRMASLVGDSGKVVAIEPTDWAFAKLTRNVGLNAAIAPRIERVQGFVAANAGEVLPGDICSSWPLDAGDSSGLDESQGRSFPTTGARVVTLAGLCEEFELLKIDLIKLDVDGHEINVLEGGLGVIERFRPAIVIELAPYVFANGDGDVCRILEMLASVGYRTAAHGRARLSLSEPRAVLSRIPKNGGINVMIQ